MKKLKANYIKLRYKIIFFIFIFLFSGNIYSNEISFKIEGNQYTDYDVILSILKNIPDNIDEEYTNEIIKILNNSNLFSDVKVKFIDNDTENALEPY